MANWTFFFLSTKYPLP